MSNKFTNFINKTIHWYVNLKLYQQLLVAFPLVLLIVIVFILSVIGSPIQYLKPKQKSIIKESIEEDIIERNETITKINKEIEKEDLKQKEIENNIENIKKEIEEELEKIDSVNNPSVDDIRKLYDSFRNRT